MPTNHCSHFHQTHCQKWIIFPLIPTVLSPYAPPPSFFFSWLPQFSFFRLTSPCVCTCPSTVIEFQRLWFENYFFRLEDGMQGVFPFFSDSKNAISYCSPLPLFPLRWNIIAHAHHHCLLRRYALFGIGELFILWNLVLWIVNRKLDKMISSNSICI